MNQNASDNILKNISEKNENIVHELRQYLNE